MYLFDTNVISELRKGQKANSGVLNFCSELQNRNAKIYLSVLTVGELRRGIELIRYRNDHDQAHLLEVWLDKVLKEYTDYILPINDDIAQIWGRLRVPHHENELDKFIAATALIYDLTMVTRNIEHFKDTSVKLFNPFV